MKTFPLLSVKRLHLGKQYVISNFFPFIWIVIILLYSDVFASDNGRVFLNIYLLCRLFPRTASNRMFKFNISRILHGCICCVLISRCRLKSYLIFVLSISAREHHLKAQSSQPQSSRYVKSSIPGL